MGRFRKLPVVIQAFKFEGVADVVHGVAIVSDGGTGEPNDIGWFMDAQAEGEITVHQGDPGHLSIRTLEGVMRADVGDWIIKGVEGEIYACKDVVFRQTYEPA